MGDGCICRLRHHAGLPPDFSFFPRDKRHLSAMTEHSPRVSSPSVFFEPRSSRFPRFAGCLYSHNPSSGRAKDSTQSSVSRTQNKGQPLFWLHPFLDLGQHTTPLRSPPHLLPLQPQRSLQHIRKHFDSSSEGARKPLSHAGVSERGDWALDDTPLQAGLAAHHAAYRRGLASYIPCSPQAPPRPSSDPRVS